jgi:hypothetical protein
MSSSSCVPLTIMKPEETAVTRQLLRKLVSAAMNTHATAEEQLDEGFSMGSVSY